MCKNQHVFWGWQNNFLYFVILSIFTNCSGFADYRFLFQLSLVSGCSGKIQKKSSCKERWLKKKKVERKSDKKNPAAENCTTAENFRPAILYSSLLDPGGIPIILIISTISKMESSLSTLIYFMRSNLTRGTDCQTPLQKNPCD